ncbi:MAG: hypothetical protein [Siphoviridae sp. ctdEk19]|nr:MAG: hypothetical protein [Siphoviridae sp. ctdEk19]
MRLASLSTEQQKQLVATIAELVLLGVRLQETQAMSLLGNRFLWRVLELPPEDIAQLTNAACDLAELATTPSQTAH